MSAYFFADALLNKGHNLKGIFFLNDAVFTALKNPDFLNNEASSSEYWRNLKIKKNLNLIICSNSALKRGIMKENIFSEFILGGAGALFDFLDNSEKVITFI